jgi:hypothetical protein
MFPRWLTWLLWAVLFGVVPYAVAALVAWVITLGQPPSLQGLFGSGQALVTAIALTAVAVRELLSVDARTRKELRYVLMFLAAVQLVLTAAAFGALSSVSAANPGQVPMDVVIPLSVATYGFALLISGLTLLVPSEASRVQSSEEGSV